jgi:hypothetical protein
MVRRSRAQWLEVLAKFEASGESLAKFCTKARIRERTLGWWRWRLRDEPRARSARDNNVRLVAVEVSPTSTATTARGGALRLVVSGVEIHLEVGTDIEYVGALVGVLRSRC